jgi:hypothetical protein
MTPRTKWTIAATLLLLLYGLGVTWWWQSMETKYDPGLWREYKMTRINTH